MWKNVVVDPLCQRAHAVGPENVSSGIGNHTIYASGQHEAKVVAYVNGELVSCRRQMTTPGHCNMAVEIVLYTSAMSHTEACEPGGRRTMSRATVEKVPQVHGNASLLMPALMAGGMDDGWWGWEKLCTAWY